MPRRAHPILLTTCLFGVAVLQAAALVVLYRFFVLTVRGQELDTIALESNRLAADHLSSEVNGLLDAISIATVAVAVAIIGFIALVRRRVALAVASVSLIAGINLTAELLKRYLDRPDLGIDEARAAAGNSFPSGHTAMAASLVVALVMVLPPRVRGAGAVFGALYAALIGVATLSAGWHRPSDAVGSMLIAGVWAALAGIVLRILRQRKETVIDAESHEIAFWCTTALGVLAAVGAGIALKLTSDVLPAGTDEVGSLHQAIAYGGATAGILAAASLVFAVILISVHHVVPHRSE